jgi:putative hydrolase of the HAD superfamily
MNAKIYVFDIDGVIIDSYRGIPIFYREVLTSEFGYDEGLAELLFRLEYLMDHAGRLRIDWWPEYLGIGLGDELFDKLIKRYWEIRIENSVLINEFIDVISSLRSRGYVVASVSYMDDIYGLKKWRMQEAGVIDLFDEVIIAGEDVPSRIDGLRIIAEKYNVGFDKIFYIDDKIQNLLYITSKIPLINVIHYRFKYPGIKWDLLSDVTVKNIKSICSAKELVEI